MSEEKKDDVFLLHQKRNEKEMKVWVTLFLLFMLFTLWFMLSE